MEKQLGVYSATAKIVKERMTNRGFSLAGPENEPIFEAAMYWVRKIPAYLRTENALGDKKNLDLLVEGITEFLSLYEKGGINVEKYESRTCREGRWATSKSLYIKYGSFTECIGTTDEFDEGITRKKALPFNKALDRYLRNKLAFRQVTFGRELLKSKSFWRLLNHKICEKVKLGEICLDNSLTRHTVDNALKSFLSRIGNGIFVGNDKCRKQWIGFFEGSELKILRE